ncbi:aminotransferase class I/II-fold pyridoxal phosphate-dependent enzyme [Terrabacter aerolatus]|uniref:cysteine-S-conjugate beta-lyase n=1 Tax=Terrabacter aerolatus TaxID=422442 RepID=A0A512CXV2_9MICO|nr:aminotransferase class I/II-fold pyridoxal phosphate-dependent enzyme [Terrabacter aerolatus]GEO29043.1 cystathionine beta-lyase [Terrabacter aerolatus]
MGETTSGRPPILGVALADLRRDRTSVKWGVHGPDVIPMWIAEMDCAPCPAVVEAVTAAVTRGDTGYALTSEYAAEVASFAEAEWSWGFDPRTTTRVSDVLTGVTHLLGLFTDVGGPVVVSPPVYNAFYEVIEACGRRVVEAPLGRDLRLDLAGLAEVFARETAEGARTAYLLSNPHNPTGTVHTAAELEGLSRVADEHGVRVVSDEIHGPLVLPGSTFTPYLTVAGTERGVTVTSASKAWNLAGLKAAIVVPGDAAVDDVRRLHPYVTFGASHLGVIAQTAAYRDGRDWLRRLVGELDANRQLLTEFVADQLPGARLVVPEATYLAWLDLGGLGLGDDPAGEVLRRARVALSPGPIFGSGGRQHARVNYATSPEILREAVGRIAGILD